MTIISISDTTRDEVIAEGALDQSVIQLEGYYYFDPDRVRMDHLILTERIYTCPYKGQALWLDLETAGGTIWDVAWVYRNPKPGYTQIKDRIGFYDGVRAGTAAVRREEG